MSRSMARDVSVPLAQNPRLLRWVDKMREMTQPATVHWVDGSQEEYDALCAQMVEAGTLIKLNEELWPGCYYARSDPGDVARVEQRTFVCSLSKDNAGPTNNWEPPFEMRRKLRERFNGAMRGRTMYVLPFSMGPIDSPMSQIGVQLTDSPYVVVNMRIMARIGIAGRSAKSTRDVKRVVPCMHSVGAPLRAGPAATCRGRATPRNTSSTSRRRARSGRTDRATAATRCSGKKCFGLRIASNIARDEGWMAEHMLILGVEDPRGREDLRRRGVPERVRQDELRHAGPAGRLRGLEGLDGRRRHRLDQAGRSMAGCARSTRRPGVFGVAPGTSAKTNPNAMATIAREHDLHERGAHARRRRLVGRA